VCQVCIKDVMSCCSSRYSNTFLASVIKISQREDYVKISLAQPQSNFETFLLEKTIKRPNAIDKELTRSSFCFKTLTFLIQNETPLFTDTCHWGHFTWRWMLIDLMRWPHDSNLTLNVLLRDFPGAF